MTLAYRCSKCGTALETSNADPLHAEVERLREQVKKLELEVIYWKFKKK